jgi:flagellar L-ring protein FlgH
MHGSPIFRWLVAFVLLTSFLALPAPVSAQSLWQQRSDRWESSIADLRALRPGDLLVITINESTDVQNRDQRQMNKQSEAGMSTSSEFDLEGLIGTANGGWDADYESSANRRFNGNTQYLSERELLDRFTVTVVDVLPNGNLLVAGKRQISLEGDTRSLVLSGQVRSVDVRPDNTISSRAVAGLDIRYESLEGGAERALINQGWLGKKFNRWWPF